MGGIVTEAPDIDNIQRNIERARQNYADAMNALRNLAPSTVKLETVIEAADEFGSEHALRLLKENHTRFGWSSSLDSSTADRLDEALATLMERTQRLDELFAERENFLCAADPTRLRRYCIDARECVIDPISNTVTFMDDPKRAYRLQEVKTEDSVVLDAHRDQRRLGDRQDPDRENEPKF
ncbi:hypothetical protein [Methyloligella solikamskensis]|uniref:Uncharacterized protein n=1 Tax=Methyloligella solikamskensis TaxID=1177756 RepID=A0ABW3J7T6_9HYPH